MAYTKKTWVNVPDPSNPPSIPNGQNALARFDAENMNRIEEGVNEAKTHREDTSLHNKATDGGAAIGSGASALHGAAVGSGASSTSGGGAVGYRASSNNGGAVGKEASTTTGAAVGSDASSTLGGAVGYNTKTGNGFAGGKEAKTVDSSGNPIDAIQIGTGTNNTPKTLKAYNYQLMNADGTIPAERMPSKAPSGHGLGDECTGEKTVSFLETAQNGCGFYRVGQAADAPDGITDWFGTLQIVRDKNAGAETGTQLAFHDFNNSKPRMWLRTIKTGEPSDWVEILHEGNKNLIYTYGEDDLTAGTSELETGKLYFVYE